MVPYTENSYKERKHRSNLLVKDAIKDIKGGSKMILLDHFKDSKRNSLNSIPHFMELIPAENIYTANIGVKKNGSFYSSKDSTNIVHLAKKLGVNAKETDIFSYLSSFQGRQFSIGYFDFCCSFKTAKQTLLHFVGNHLDVSKKGVLAFTTEMHRSMHREEKHSNNELIRQFVFGDLKSYLPFTFADPVLLVNERDSSNTMQFVIVQFTPREYPHHSHLVFNARDTNAYQVVFKRNTYEKGIIKYVGTGSELVEWSTKVKTPVDFEELLLILPEGVSAKGETPIRTHTLLKKEIVKRFNNVPHVGVIEKAYQVKRKLFFLVKYETDGDEEELTEAEVKRLKRN